MRHTLKTLCVAAGAVACMSAQAELVEVTLHSPTYPDFVLTFEDGKSGFANDNMLELGEFVSMTSVSFGGSTYTTLREIATANGQAVGNGGSNQVVDGYTLVASNTKFSVTGPGGTPLSCTGVDWCFSGTTSAGSDILFQLPDSAFNSGGGGYRTAKVLDVPEPGSLALLGVALAGLGLTRRRKQ